MDKAERKRVVKSVGDEFQAYLEDHLTTNYLPTMAEWDPAFSPLLAALTRACEGIRDYCVRVTEGGEGKVYACPVVISSLKELQDSSKAGE